MGLGTAHRAAEIFVEEVSVAKKTRVLIVDDSASIQKLLARLLSSAEDIEVVGFASDPYEAREKMVELRPDVLSLDIEMPRMDGLTFLSKVMAHRPMPVVIVSSVAGPQTEASLRALELGAVEIMDKRTARRPMQYANAIRRASVARVTELVRRRKNSSAELIAVAGPTDLSADLIAIGASTGGPAALSKLFARFPARLPPIVVVQHIPGPFTKPLAERLSNRSRVSVAESEEGVELTPGTAWIAKGTHHLTVEKRDGKLYMRHNQDDPVNFHRPSVNVLFQSLVMRDIRCVAVLLTGMGDDGATGLLALRQAGQITLAQDKETSLIHGMPGAAERLGAAMQSVPLPSMAKV
ncbi:MAG: chemotaxis-specific protein-glutamate methyltransferase CheB, partial [Myxococcota bacterium]